MGNGLTPGPVGGHVDGGELDSGTAALTTSPPPDVVGLDAGGGSASRTSPSMADRIVGYPRVRLGDRVEDGQCFSLVDTALRTAGAKGAADFGKVTPRADYVWGTPVRLANVRPGDVIQFRDYEYQRRVDTSNSDGSSAFQVDGQTRPHHTAVVESVDGNGALTALEQNSPVGTPVTRTQLFFLAGRTKSGSTTTTITVKGTTQFYRPQPK